MDTELLLVGLVIVALVAIALVLYQRKTRSRHLQRDFGPEYGRTVETMGSRDKAESELLARRMRVEQLHIVPLSPADAQQFQQAWRAVQGRFVDNPQGALAEADALVRELMHRRGYPMGDFERSAADVSVNHPHVVEHYRAAHAIAERDRRGEVDTEGRRQAVIHYRALFAELLETDEPGRHDSTHHPDMRTQS